MSIIQRTLFAFILMSAFIVVVALFGLFGMNHLRDSLNTTTSELMPLQQKVLTMKDLFSAVNNKVLVHEQSSNLEEMQKIEAQYIQLKSELVQQIDLVTQSVPPQLTKKSNSILLRIEEKDTLSNDISNELFALDNQKITLSKQYAQSLTKFNTALVKFTQESDNFKVSKVTARVLAKKLTAKGKDVPGLVFSVLETQTTDEFLKKQKSGLLLAKDLMSTHKKLLKLEAKKAGRLTESLEVLVDAIAIESGVVATHGLKIRSKETITRLNIEMAQLNEIMEQDVDQIVKMIADYANEQVKISSENSDNMYRMIVISSSIILLVALGVGFSIYRSIKLRVRTTLQGINYLSDGDFTHPIKSQGRDEFAQIAHKLDELSEKLRVSLQGVTDKAVSLSNEANSASTISQTTENGMFEQKLQTDSVATAVTQMEAAIIEVATNAQGAKDQIELVVNTARVNGDIMNDTTADITKLNDAIASAQSIIGSANEHSESINSILGVIQAIADQTNLLALNAAIESARAGEHGRGFAVVADEVRSLSKKTHSSITQISEMISGLQQSTNNAVNIMATSQEQAVVCQNNTERSSEALQGMTEALLESNDRVIQIASATEEQSLVAKEINENLIAISDLADQVKNDSQLSLQASENVQKLSGEQKALVEVFKF
jgi:methyl-accepting chemotaxis protein